MTRRLITATLLGVLAVPPALAAPPDGLGLPPGAVHRFGNRQLRHPDGIYSTLVSPDGKLLATVGSSTVIVWDLQTLQPKCVLRGQSVMAFTPDAGAGRVAFTADSKALVVTSYPRSGMVVRQLKNEVPTTDIATVFDVATGKPRFTLKGNPDYYQYVWLSAGGKELVLGGRTGTRFYDAADGKELRRTDVQSNYYGPTWLAPAADRVLTTVYQPNGQMGLSVVDARLGKEIYSTDVGGRLRTAALSSDGKQLVYHDPAGVKVRVFDLEAKKELYAFDHPAGQQSGPMRISADGSTLYFGGQHGQIYRWNLKENRKLPDVGRHSTWTLTSLALSPDESMLYSAGNDKLIRRWDLKTGKQLPLPEGYITQTAVAPTPDGKHLLVADHGGALDLYELATGKRAKAIISSVGMHGMDCVAVSDDGRWFAGGRTVQDIRLYDLKSGKEERVIPLVEKPDTKGSDHVKRVAFGPGGQVLYSGSAQTGTTAWEVTTGKKLWRTGGAAFLAVDPLGRYVVSGGGYNHEVIRLTFLNATTGEVTRLVDVAAEAAPVIRGQFGGEPIYPPYVTDLRFTPDGSRLVTSHYDATVRLWDPDTGKQVGRLSHDLRGATGLACSPDSKWVAVGRSDGKIIVWELATEKQLLTLDGHDSMVRDVAFTTDGRGLVGNADLAPILWDLVPKDLPAVDNPEAAWKDLATGDAERAYRLVWGLAREPKRAVKLFAEKVKPAELTIERARFDKWVADLDSPQYRAREAAEKGLTQAGPTVPVGWLRKALADTRSDEVRARVGRVLSIRDKPLPDEWRLGRAVQVLERAGTDEAKSLLKTWAAAPAGTQVAVDAQAALERLGRR
jgi:WD40 repeat protein